MDPDTDVCQTEQPQISYSFDFIAEQSKLRAIQYSYSIFNPKSQSQSPKLLGRESGRREGTRIESCIHVCSACACIMYHVCLHVRCTHKFYA